jgi:hypothetical protein
VLRKLVARWKAGQVGYHITLTRRTCVEGSEQVQIVGNCATTATVDEVAEKVGLMGEACRRRLAQNNAAIAQAEAEAQAVAERRAEHERQAADALAAQKTLKRMK